MAKVQTRRSVSVSKRAYTVLKLWATQRSMSMSQITEELIDLKAVGRLPAAPRSVALDKPAWDALKRLADERDQSMAAIVDRLIYDAAKAKPDTLASVPKGGGPVDAFALRLESILRQRVEQIESIRAAVRRRREKLGVSDTDGADRADRDAENAATLLSDLADMVRAVVLP